MSGKSGQPDSESLKILRQEKSGENLFLEVLSGDNGVLPPQENDRLLVEDNVGEAIHIHYREVRIDLTVDEFIRFAEMIENLGGGVEDGSSN